jgi:lipopolysaccharide/colanic/teichoic acid biosynthesis glycosyltransferase
MVSGSHEGGTFCCMLFSCVQIAVSFATFIFMKDKLVFILEPCAAIRVILMNRLHRTAVCIGFSSVRSLKAALEFYPQPQIILLPVSINERLTFLEHTTLVYFEKPFNPDRVVKEVARQLAVKTAIIKWNRRLLPSELQRGNRAIIQPSSIKWVLESAAALALLILLSPLLLVISIGILLDSGGPVLYRSRRAGRAYRVFDFYKFRTMSEEHTSTAFVKIQEGAGMTAFGRWLRSTSLDELPQLWNVVKGDMSIVGNRPLPLYEAELLTTDEWAQRFMAPAGITGLWQVKRRHNPDMTVAERLRLDIAYARRNGFLIDAGILFQTPRAMWQKVPAGAEASTPLSLT